MAIVGQHFYDEVTDTRLTINPIPFESEFDLSGLPANNDYLISATNVDAAGNESPRSVPFPFSTLPVTSTPDPALSAADIAAVDAIVAGVMNEYKQPGVNLIVTGPRGKYARAYGVSDTTNNTPLSLDDHYRIGSITKLFTAHAVMRYIDSGLLEFTDILEDYVPGVPNGSQITIRDLLMHRSGVYEYTAAIGMTMVMSPTAAYSEDEALKVIKANPSQFPPGSKTGYSNSNYILLGAVLRAVTGRPIRNIIIEDIIEPSGLLETTWPTGNLIPAPYTKGAGPKGLLGLLGIFGDVSSFNPELAGAAGAITSTVGDLSKWMRVIRDGDLLSDEMHEDWLNTFEAIPNTTEGPTQLGYGLGLMQFGRWVGHNGAIPGFGDIAMFDPETGASIVVMENIQLAKIPFQVVFHRVAKYLYPDSLTAPTYPVTPPLGITIRPSAALVTVTGGTPRVTVANPNYVAQPGPALVTVTGGTPGSAALVISPAAATVTVTGGTPTVTVESAFTPFTEENLTRVARPVPEGLTKGVYVTLLGGGGNGNPKSSGTGGRGGVGGARLGEVLVPKELLGPVYDVDLGAIGTPVKFASGDVVLTAEWGRTGSNIASVASAVGLSGVPTANGGIGGAGGSSSGSNGQPGGAGLNGAGSGGGGGGGGRDNASGSGGAPGAVSGGDPAGLNKQGAPGAAGSAAGSGSGGRGGGGGGYTAASGITGGTSLARLRWV